MTYKSKFTLVCVIVAGVVITCLTLFAKNLNRTGVEDTSAPIQVETGTDMFNNEYVFNFFEDEQFGTLNVYMPEDKNSSWQWVDIENKITCNYINYQDDHYVISFKADDSYTDKCQAVVALIPLEETHGTESEVNEYNSYIIEVVTQDGVHGYNIKPATFTDEYTVDEDVTEHNHENDAVAEEEPEKLQ